MDQMQIAIDVMRHALWITLMISLPILMAGLIIGVMVSIVQAATQIQEQTLAFVPKILIVIITLVVLSPWILQQMMEYTSFVFSHMHLFFNEVVQ